MSSPDAFEFHLKLRGLSTIEQMAGLFREAIAPHGFDTFACGELDLSNRDRTVFYSIDWPERWRRFYLQSKLVERDPIVETLAYHREPYTWSDLRRERRFHKLGREALDLAAKHGWTEGLVVPMPGGGRRIGLVSMAGTQDRISPDQRAYLSLVSIGFHLHVRTLVCKQGFAAPPAGLTDRELTCVKLVAEGLSDAQIARRMRVATSTAHEFVEKAKRRIGVHNRPALIAVAVSLGIVDP
jgi:LuxR family transcriptional regulator, quorum-sensing system regulator BjaR1